MNAPEVLRRELRRLRKDHMFLSSASDPYQPPEAKYRLTMRCLEQLLRSGWPVSILTKSPLVLRDLDLLEKLPRVSVGMSITTVPVRGFEPGVPPLARRIDTLRKLARAGIRTWVSLAPVVPGIVMVDLDELFEELSEVGVTSVSYGILRFAGYAESRKMFEEAAGRSAVSALAGSEALVERLSRLVHRYGMDARDDRAWAPGPAEAASLDDYFR